MYMYMYTFFLTSADNASEVEKQRRKPGGQSITIKKPTAIEKYNKEMGGIDIEDQLITMHIQLCTKDTLLVQEGGLQHYHASAPQWLYSR